MDGLYYKPDTITGVEDEKGDHRAAGKRLTINPNPVTYGETLSISLTGFEISGSALLEIFNLSGERVLTTNVENENRVTLSTKGLASGVYLARVTSERGTATGKFLIVR